MGEKSHGTIGRYEIRGEIGRGSMGVVYDAYDPELERPVAVKTISVAFAVSALEREAFEARFFAEARIAARLSHPGIVVVHDVGRDANTEMLFMVLERLQGRTLAQLLTEVPQLDWRQAAHVVHGVAEALQFAHAQRVIHRDIKPANIMLLDSGDPKIMDFGIAKIETTRLKLTMSGKFFGTPLYMSPEQALGHRLDHRIDLFALGAVAYELITGRLAFGAQSLTKIIEKVILEDPSPPSGLVPELPPDLDYVMARALAKDRESRYADGTKLAEDMVDVLAGRPPRHREGWTPPKPGAHPHVTELQAARLRDEALLPPPVEDLDLEPELDLAAELEASPWEIKADAGEAEAEIVTLVSPPARGCSSVTAAPPSVPARAAASTPLPTGPTLALPGLPMPPASAPASVVASRGSVSPAPAAGAPPSPAPTSVPAQPSFSTPVPEGPITPPAPSRARRRFGLALGLGLVGVLIGTVIGSRFPIPWSWPPATSPAAEVAALPAEETAGSSKEVAQAAQAPAPPPASSEAVPDAPPDAGAGSTQDRPPTQPPTPTEAAPTRVAKDAREAGEPAAGSRLAASVPAASRSARLGITLEHSLESGKLRVWVDGNLALEEGLESRVTKKALVLKGRKGNLEETLNLNPGEHDIRMEVAWEDNVRTKEISGRFKAGSTRRLSARLGGVIRRNLSLEWK